MPSHQDFASSLVNVVKYDHRLEITLNRPEKRNAINKDMANALDAALNQLEDDADIRVGLLTAAGTAFSAGSDVNSIGDYMTTRGGEYGLLRRRRKKPLIAVVEGIASGGGMEIVLACDLVVASTSATFALPEVARGLVPGLAIFTATHALPLNIAKEMELTGVPLDTIRAHQIGFVNRIAEPGSALEVGRQVANQIAENSPTSVSTTLLATNDYVAQDESLGWALAERARETIADSADAAEGVAAFLEKRPPQWSSR